MATRSKKPAPQASDEHARAPRTPSTPPTVIPVSDDLVGERLDRALAQLFPNVSRTRAQAAIKAGAVRVNGQPARASHLLEAGQQIELDASALTSATPGGSDAQPPLAEAIPLRVVYEDDHLLVVDKPAGLVVHPAPGHATGTLVNALLAHLPGRLTNAALSPSFVDLEFHIPQHHEIAVFDVSSRDLETDDVGRAGCTETGQVQMHPGTGRFHGSSFL